MPQKTTPPTTAELIEHFVDTLLLTAEARLFEKMGDSDAAKKNGALLAARGKQIITADFNLIIRRAVKDALLELSTTRSTQND